MNSTFLSQRPSLRRESAIAAIGVAFLAAGVVVSALNSRPDGDLDLANFAVGLVAALALLATAAAALVAISEPDSRSHLVVWPTAFGSLASGLMIVIAFDASTWSVYLGALVVLVISIGGYLIAPGGALAISALIGAGVLYGRLVDDLINVDDFDNGFILAGLVVLIFTVVATGLGWLLPRTRELTGVVVGGFAVAAYFSIMIAIGFASLLGGVLLVDTTPDPFGPPVSPEVESYTADVYVTLAFALLLIGAWGVAAYLTANPGFKVLIVAMTATVLPAATFALAVEHPVWWGLGAALVGGVVLALMIASGRDEAPPVAAASYPPPAVDAPPPPTA